MKRGYRFLPLLFLIFVFNTISFAQPSEMISDLEVSEGISGQPVEIKAELFTPSEISSIYIAFRNFGQTDFLRREMEVRGTAAYGIIPAEYVSPPSLEYYIVVTTNAGRVESYPPGSPTDLPPLRLEIKSLMESDSDVLILSPGIDEQVSKDELLISISFIKAPEDVDASATKIYIDGKEITEYALFAEDLIILSGANYPDNISISAHSLKIEVYDNQGNLKSTTRRAFKVVSDRFADSEGRGFTYYANLKGETRNESYNEETIWYNNLDARFTGDYNDWNFDAKVYLTSEEKIYRQPQNRYSASVTNNWFDLTFGDSYPIYSEMIMSGKRVRGVDATLDVGFFSLQASYGQINRDIEGALLETFPGNQVDSTLLASNVIDIDPAKYGNPYGRVDLGEFSRDVLAIRPAFRTGRTFEFGLTLLKSGDDKNSIEFGTRPKENLVLGSDFKLNFDNNRIQIGGEAAFSFNNSDISTGTLTDEQIDSVFGGDKLIDVDPAVVKDLKGTFGGLIEVNQFFGPWNPEELASLASEASIGLNYFNNNFKAKYIYRGNDYVSFGQTYLRTDLKGINLVDRIRMIDNKVFLSLGFERLEDNLQDTKIATTTYQTINSSVSIYAGEGIPNFTLGYTRYDNNNDLTATDSSAIDDATNKFYLQLSHNFELEIPHNAYVYFSTANREDNTLWNRSSENLSITLNVKSEWNRMFTSHIGGTYYSSESAATPYDYSSIFIGGTVNLMQDKLEIRATLSPSFGDFERQSLDLLANYNVIENLVLSLQARFYRIPDVSTNSIVGLITRYTL